MEVEASRRATEYICEHGGKLYVYAEPVGDRSDWEVLHASTNRPYGIEFARWGLTLGSGETFAHTTWRIKP